MELFWILFFFFIAITIIFIAIAMMFPEWVGITGKKALEIQKHQTSEQLDNDDTQTKKES